jgi:adenylosuccinate synthase
MPRRKPRVSAAEAAELRAEMHAEDLAAERRFEELVDQALSVPVHMIDDALEVPWREINTDVAMHIVLREWLEQLLVYDPSFLRHVCERQRDVLRPRREQGLSLSISEDDE